MCQQKYALEIVYECGLLGAKPASFLTEENHKLALATSPLLQDPTRYRRLVGRLIYLTITRPNLAYAIYILSQFIQEPREEHMEAARRVVRYLEGSTGQGILLPKENNL